MKVSFRHTRTGLLALAAAGIVAAGTVAERANRVHGVSAVQHEPAEEAARLAERAEPAPGPATTAQ